MNKLNKVLLAIMGGISAVFDMVTPILLVLIWISLVGWISGSSYLLLAAAIISSLFKAIKIGWMK